MAAVMTQQAAGKAVLDQPGAAIRALEAMAAGAAQGQRRIAAAVEKQQRLLARGKGFGQCRDERRRQKAAGFDPLAAQIDEPHLGERRFGVAPRQADAAIAPARDIDHGLERRRRRHQHDRHAGQRGAQHRHVAGLVADPVLLLVGGVVLLIDDDQAKLGKRQKQRRARADNDARPAVGDRAPGAAPLALADLGMPLRRGGAEAVAKPLQPLRAERDFRQQHQHLPAGGEGCRDRGEIGLGLARAGDAVEQGDAETAGFDSGDKPASRKRLVGG